jgi:hypothetical protein
MLGLLLLFLSYNNNILRHILSANRVYPSQVLQLILKDKVFNVSLKKLIDIGERYIHSPLAAFEKNLNFNQFF